MTTVLDGYHQDVISSEICTHAETCFRLIRECVIEQAPRPSVLYRPSLAKDGDAWIALYGVDLATGVVGCGASPAEAMADFDRAWNVALAKGEK